MTYIQFNLFLVQLCFFYLEYTEFSGSQYIAYFFLHASARNSSFLLSRLRIEMIIFHLGFVEFLVVKSCIKSRFVVFQLVEISYGIILYAVESEYPSNVYLCLFHGMSYFRFV